MLSPAARSLLFQTMRLLIINAGHPIDTRVLITQTVRRISSLGVNRFHAAGMLSALKRSGMTFAVITPGRLTLVS